MNYTFVKVQCHPKVPNLQAWYLKICPHEFALYADVHMAVASQTMMRMKSDPHNYRNEEWTDNMEVSLYHPVKLSGAWLTVTLSRLLENQPILVNKVGGWIPFDKDTIVIETKVRRAFSFPEIETNTSERITIKRWPNGKHWYMVSSANRIFFPDKYTSLQQAMNEAKKYVPEKQIRVDETKTLKPE